MEYTRITVPLSREEFTALTQSAQCDYRHPRDQARALLRRILLGDSWPGQSCQTTTKNKTTASLDSAGGLVATHPY